MSETGYLLGNENTDAGARLAALCSIFDHWTFEHLDRRGITTGWRCWEVGAGGLSVARHMREKVGDSGRVLATDIDLTWMSGTGGRFAADPALEVRHHDLSADALPEEEFDLIHARLLLVHLSDRSDALHKLVSTLRPGGWLVVEDADPALQPLSCMDPTTPAEHLANKIRTGFRALMAERGVDLAYGRKLPGALRDAGLALVASDAYLPVALPECAALETATVKLIGEQLLTAGIATEAEIEIHLANVAAGGLDLSQPPLISAWGQRPVTSVSQPISSDE